MQALINQRNAPTGNLLEKTDWVISTSSYKAKQLSMLRLPENHTSVVEKFSFVRLLDLDVV